MSNNTYYEVVVLGAGSGGLTSAVALTKLGKKVLLIEKTHLGGECTNSGCIPSKALLHHAKAYAAAVAIAGTSNESETYHTQAWEYVRQKINEILADETVEHFKAQGIDVVLGEGIFTAAHTITVAGTNYHFKQAIIATGSSPRSLTISGLTPELILTNQNLFALHETPAHTLIIGAGPIGMEMGQALALLGSKVTIVDNGPRFARLEDSAISPIITKTFTDQGITLLQNAQVTEVINQTATIETKDEAGAVLIHHIPFSKVLVAVGRVPNLPQGLSEAGIISTEYGITVDRAWRTSQKNIYALGDVSARLKFTHVADDTARQVVTHIISKGLISPKEKLVPKVTYTEPEIGQVGLSWEEAIAQYGTETIIRIEVPLSANDRARTESETTGLLILIAKRLTGKILGAHLIGPRAGELIGTLTLAMENNISLYRLRATIFAYPTYSLLLKRAGDYFLAAQFASLRTDLIYAGKKVLPKLVLAALWLFALTALYTYKETYGFTLTELTVRLFHFISSSWYGPLLYILAYTVRPLTFFPGTALTILSGVFFGLLGIIYTVIGANLSAALAYGVGRYFTHATTDKTSLLSRFLKPLQEHPFITILTMRLTFLPFDVVNYGAGIFRVPFLPYLLATVLGTLLGIATFVSIGASLSVEEFLKDGITANAIDAKFVLLSLTIFLISLALAKVLKKG